MAVDVPEVCTDGSSGFDRHLIPLCVAFHLTSLVLVLLLSSLIIGSTHVILSHMSAKIGGVGIQEQIILNDFASEQRRFRSIF
jgi:hypothetical protein